MDDNNQETTLQWYHPRRLGLTGEYCAGILEGIGIGVILMVCLTEDHLMGSGWTLATVPGFVMIAIGTSIQRHILRKRVRNNNNLPRS